MAQQSQISQLPSSAYISQALVAIKKDVQEKRDYASNPQVSASSFLQKAISVRSGFRELAEGIEAKRMLAQLQKQKIQKCKIFLEGLQYFKETIKNKIKESQIETIDLTDYLDEPLRVGDWIGDFKNVEGHLMSEVGSKRQKKKRYEELLLQKQRREVESREKKQFFEKVLPQHAKKIYQQIQETSKMLNIQQFQELEKINNRDLAVIYDKLSPLSTNKIIELTIAREEFEEIEVVIAVSGHQWFNIANKNKINIVEREITFTFTCLSPHFDGLVVGLNRREDFTNQEVFQRLYNDERIQQIFTNPQNEMERNINAKYVRLPWIDAMLNGIVSPQRVLQLIKERVFCLQLMRYLCENVKKVSFFFPFHVKVDSAQVPINLKKVTTGSLQKISFREYLQLVHLPSWVNKYLTTYDLLQSEYKSKNIDKKMSAKVDRSNFQSILKTMNLQEIGEAGVNDYYRGSFVIPQNVLNFVLILPTAYPLEPSRICITQWQTTRKEEEKSFKMDVPCKLVSSKEFPVLTDAVLGLQHKVNEQISEFIANHGQYVPFRVLFQLNRLLTLLGEHKHLNE